jgi:hypothetical protein
MRCGYVRADGHLSADRAFPVLAAKSLLLGAVRMEGTSREYAPIEFSRRCEFRVVSG